MQNKTFNKRNLTSVVAFVMIASLILTGRLAYLMIYQADHYGVLAKQVHERERSIKAERGKILDCNGVELANNKPVCTISVIHSQITDPEKVIQILSDELGLSEEKVRKRVEKVSSIERVKSNVEKELADRIREYDLDGVMIDEDYKRYYPLGSLASKVIGFTGSDNQGIIGLEVEYEKYLHGLDGTILTLTTARGVEIKNAAENRVEPVAGNNLTLSLDVNIQKYAQQAAKKVFEAKQANNVKLIAMNPQNGEIYAMVNYPEFDLNDPYTLNVEEINAVMNARDCNPQNYNFKDYNSKQKNDALNQMWRNGCISDSYEPGSTFKVVTATSALEEGVVRLDDRFNCPGFKVVEDRRIRCHKTAGHGTQTFIQGIQNSCNPVFMEVGARVGSKGMYKNFKKLGLFEKTGIDVPGEAGSIMHKIEDVKPVELATMSFGQGFQITPLELLRAASAVVNGGTLVTPHFGVSVSNADGSVVKKIQYPEKHNVIRKETSDTMKMLLESVVSQGSGKNAYIEGYEIGGKTATSEKLPRRSGKYISSFLGFAPADDPKIIAIVLIDEPVGTYYGGTIAAPVIKELMANVLPYLGVEEKYKQTEDDKSKQGQ